MKTCDHAKDKALDDPPGGSWRIEQERTASGKLGRKRIACRECGKFFGYFRPERAKRRRGHG